MLAARCVSRPRLRASAAAVYWRTVERIIEKEKPNALLPTMGGQTALNCALDLADNGVLEKYGVELIGAKRDAIRMAEVIQQRCAQA